MSARQQIVGTLGVLKQRKPRSSDWITDALCAVIEEATGKTRYFAPMMWLTNERKRSATANYIYKFRRVPLALRDAEPGSIVTVEASLDEWPNGIGAYLVRPRIIAVAASNEKERAT